MNSRDQISLCIVFSLFGGFVFGFVAGHLRSDKVRTVAVETADELAKELISEQENSRSIAAEREEFRAMLIENNLIVP